MNITDESELLPQRSMSPIKNVSAEQFHIEKISISKKSGTTCNI